MTTRRSWAVYGMLFAIWITLIIWQTAEHLHARKAFHDSLIDHGRYVSTTCAQLLRSGGFGVVTRERLETNLNALVSTKELRSVELLNNADEVVASAGPPIELPPRSEFTGGVYWSDSIAILQNPIDLGTNMPQLVMPRGEFRSMQTNRLAANTNSESASRTNRPPRRSFNWRQERPYWMTEADYRALLETKGAHAFVVAMSTEPVLFGERYDLWMRIVIVLLGTAAVSGFGLAWRSLINTSELQLRLVRASELNLHLREMNLAAAGLAHETRNPLNIIRGLAQLICKQENITPEIRVKSRDIIDETDRVTAQLNEFINYSRPREVRRAPVNLRAVATEVARALNYDLEEKKIQLEIVGDDILIEADEQLLRQALFNLALNATQAVPPQGIIQIRGVRCAPDEAVIEISDNGPGVPSQNRTEIFKPYFTTQPEGTGLGLSVVQQIVLAHGWEIQCLPNEPQGALFRISHVKIKMKE